MSAAQPTRPARDEDTRFFGQPWSLVHIFGVEMWERFSFYGMQGILLIYLYYSATQGGLGIPEAVAGGIVGAYGGSVYLSTILGAWLADRLFGSERVLFVSAIVIVAGHIALALLPGLLGVGVGLVLVALGSGGLKANATSVVGRLYAPTTPVAMRASRCSTSASTSGRSWDRSSPASCSPRSASTTASASPRSA
jgi:POT family proton-dependent oligopeptide transporter